MKNTVVNNAVVTNNNFEVKEMDNNCGMMIVKVIKGNNRKTITSTVSKDRNGNFASLNITANIEFVEDFFSTDRNGRNIVRYENNEVIKNVATIMIEDEDIARSTMNSVGDIFATRSENSDRNPVVYLEVYFSVCTTIDNGNGFKFMIRSVADVEVLAERPAWMSKTTSSLITKSKLGLDRVVTSTRSNSRTIVDTEDYFACTSSTKEIKETTSTSKSYEEELDKVAPKNEYGSRNMVRVMNFRKSLEVDSEPKVQPSTSAIDTELVKLVLREVGAQEFSQMSAEEKASLIEGLKMCV